MHLGCGLVCEIKTGRSKTKCSPLNVCVLYIIVDITEDVQHHHVHFNITLPLGTCLHCSVCFIPLHTGLHDFFKNKCVLQCSRLIPVTEITFSSSVHLSVIQFIVLQCTGLLQQMITLCSLKECYFNACQNRKLCFNFLHICCSKVILKYLCHEQRSFIRDVLGLQYM